MFKHIEFVILVEIMCMLVMLFDYKSLTVSKQNDVLKELPVSEHVRYLWHELASKNDGQQTTQCTYL